MKRLITGLALASFALLFVFWTNTYVFCLGLFFILVFSIYELQKIKIKKNFYIWIIFFLILLNIFLVYPISQYFDRSLFFTALVISVLTDVSAFVFGNLMGKRYIFPNISPNKTLEGTLSGIVIPGILLLLFTLTLSEYQFLYSFLELSPMIDSWGIAYTFLALMFCSLMSIAGDLIASKAKRTIAIKDFGNLLPGHGGILDRIDSHLVCIPIFFFLNSLI